MDAKLDLLIAKLEEARLLLLEIEALLVPEDADGLNPPPSQDTPA